ncbi:hypothetical protein HJ01_00413 [Flavobacterium frigoris PS1]|uniref:Uncharacterized protein n=1 Tax=Flavobacterium frigoris (strain PS1) TaxID=1086011 RepID=H7FME4_FLAFP|nr:hypothetical protein HJ01_00413 [Flavobacterium frigoris PS1]
MLNKNLFYSFKISLFLKNETYLNYLFDISIDDAGPIKF